MLNQLEEIRKISAEKYRKSDKNTIYENKGTVIGGKYFKNPPKQINYSDYLDIINIYQRIDRQKPNSFMFKFDKSFNPYKFLGDKTAYLYGLKEKDSFLYKSSNPTSDIEKIGVLCSKNITSENILTMAKEQICFIHLKKDKQISLEVYRCSDQFIDLYKENIFSVIDENILKSERPLDIPCKDGRKTVNEIDIEWF